MATACGGSAASTTSTVDATTSSAPATTTTSRPEPDASAELLERFPTLEMSIGAEAWLVAWAGTPELRSQGLMGVTDLGDIDGMLFTWDADSTSGFWMKDTLIALDVAFFRADGSLVDVLTMVPCEADPCPSYRSSGPYRYALEAPAGCLTAMGAAELDLPEAWPD